MTSWKRGAAVLLMIWTGPGAGWAFQQASEPPAEEAEPQDESQLQVFDEIQVPRLGHEFANGLSLALEVFNLFDEKASDIDYFYESRLPGETEPVADRHFHPAEKRSARLVAEWRY